MTMRGFGLKKSVLNKPNRLLKPARPFMPASTKRKDPSVKTALRESEIRYRRLFEAAQDGILILQESTGRITDVNQFLIDLLGLSREQFIGKMLWEIGLFPDVDKSRKAFQELKRKA